MSNKEINNIKISMQEMKDCIQHLKDGQDALAKKLDLFIETSDRKYAPMEAWTLLKFFGSIVGTILIGSAVYIIFSNGIIR